MSIIDWWNNRRTRAKAGVSLPSGWPETKGYLARIVSHPDDWPAYGRQSLRLFVENAFSSNRHGHLSDAERLAFVSLINASERGEAITSRSVPDVHDPLAQERFRNWVFNIVRMDVACPPRGRDVLLLSVAYTKKSTMHDLLTAYRHFAPTDGNERLHDLTKIASETRRRLGELGVFIPSVVTLVANGFVPFEDIFLVPALATEFVYDSSLFMLEPSGRPYVLISKRWWHCGIPSPLSFITPGVRLPEFPDAIAELKQLAKVQSWKVETLFQPEATWI